MKRNKKTVKERDENYSSFGLKLKVQIGVSAVIVFSVIQQYSFPFSFRKNLQFLQIYSIVIAKKQEELL